MRGSGEPAQAGGLGLGGQEEGLGGQQAAVAEGREGTPTNSELGTTSLLSFNPALPRVQLHTTRTSFQQLISNHVVPPCVHAPHFCARHLASAPRADPSPSRFGLRSFLTPRAESTQMHNLSAFPPPPKQATSAYEIKNLYKPASSSSLASMASRPSFKSSLSFPTPPSSSDSASSPPSSPETDTHPSRQGSDSSSTEEEEENDSVPAPLPTVTVKPRGIREREQARLSGKKPVTMAAAVARKRAEEMKWQRYAQQAPITFTLNLTPDELAGRA